MERYRFLCQRKLNGLFLIAAITVVSLPAQAQMLANPVRLAPVDRVGAAGALALSDVSYDFDRGNEPEFDREVLVAALGFGLEPTVDLFGQIGLIYDSEIDDIEAEGDGYMFGGGARFHVYEEQRFRIISYGLLNLTKESFDFLGGFKCNSSITDLHGGITTAFQANAMVAPYGGIDLALYSSGDFKCRGGSKTDIERSDVLSLRIGANFEFKALYLRPEVLLAGEDSFVLSIGAKL